MRTQLLQEAELAKRKGFALRTIVALLWLTATAVLAYFVTNWLFESEILRPGFFYSRLLVPATVSIPTIRIGVTVLIVVAIQFFILIGYGFSSPVGRRRPGQPTNVAKDPDPLDSMYYR